MPVVSDQARKYIHNLVDRLFQIREETSDGFNSSTEHFENLSDQAIDIVFEIMWTQAHWAIRNKLGAPRGKIRKQTIDEQRITLIKWLSLFVKCSSLHPNALPLQEIIQDEIYHLLCAQRGIPHRYGDVAEKGQKGLADVKQTLFIIYW